MDPGWDDSGMETLGWGCESPMRRQLRGVWVRRGNQKATITPARTKE